MKNNYNFTFHDVFNERKATSQKKQSKLTPRLFGISLSFLMILLMSNDVLAQTTYPNDVQQWTFIEEDAVHDLEASYKVEQCTSTSAPMIILQIFNEKSDPDTANISVTIYKPDYSDSTVSNINLPIGIGDMLMPVCGSSLNASLRLTVPTGYDPEKLKVKVKFN